jgi:hypothetical protein
MLLLLLLLLAMRLVTLALKLGQQQQQPEAQATDARRQTRRVTRGRTTPTTAAKAIGASGGAAKTAVVPGLEAEWAARRPCAKAGGEKWQREEGRWRGRPGA